MISLRALNHDLSGSSESALAFAQALAEYRQNESWNPATRGWAADISVRNRRHFRTIEATTAVSFIQTYERALAAGNEDLARQCLAGCFSVLDPLVQAGAELDPPMRELHARLKPMLTQA